jgi:hypothetical protein
MLGREVSLPIDIIFGRPEEEPSSVDGYAAELRKRLEKAHKAVCENLGRLTKKQKGLL